METLTKRQSGFTLIELMIVIAVIAIISAVAIPSTLSWRENAQLRRAARDIYSDFQRVKLEAVKRNIDCSIAFDGGGYSAYVETVNANRSLDAGEPVIASARWSEYGTVSEISNTFIATPVAFGNNGMLVSGGGLGGTLVLQNGTGHQVRVIVSAAGVIRTTQ